MFLFTTASRTALGPTQPPIQGVPGTLSLGVNRPGRQANSHPSSAEVKNACSYTSTPPIRLHGVVLRQEITGTILSLALIIDIKRNNKYMLGAAVISLFYQESHL